MGEGSYRTNSREKLVVGGKTASKVGLGWSWKECGGGYVDYNSLGRPAKIDTRVFRDTL